MPQPSAPTWKRAAFSAIARSERALRGARTREERLREIRNFLLLQYESPLGSVVHATPLLEALKTAMPDAYIAVAASRMAASVLSNSPFLDGRLTATASPFSSFRSAAADAQALLRAMPSGPRCVITTIGNQRTRLAILGLLSGKAVRAGYTLAPELYDIPLTFTPERGQIESNLDILRALGHEVAFCEPRVFFSHLDANSGSQLLQSLLDQADAPRIVFVTQNSGGQRNQWKAERFRQVIADLSQSCSAVPVFVGIAEDASAIESLRNSLPNASISLAGKTTVPQLAAVLAQCDLIVSLDTGTFHVARAVGLPGVVIAPAWQDPREWLPVNHPRYRVLRGSSIGTAPPDYWIEEVSAEQVSAAARDLLGNFPASAAARTARVQAAVRGPL